MENSILGTKEVKIDEKNRIKLIKSFGISAGESVVLITKKDHIEVRDKKLVFQTLIELKEKVKEVTDFELLQFYQEQIDYITACANYVAKVDNQSRFNIGVELKDKYQLTDSVVLEGILDGFRIWKPNVFREHKRNVIDKISSRK